jgi:PDZ domain-containing protein
VGVVVLVALVLGSFVGIKVPYVELGPGPTWNTLGTTSGKQLIAISGGTTSSSQGQLRMVTVGVEDQISLWQAIQGWLDPSDAVVPREVIYPPDQTQQQVDQQNQEDFKDSQSSAQTAALRKLGFPVQVSVQSVVAGQPADGRLKAGDVITSVNGEQVTSAEKLTSLIKAKPAGTALAVGYTRDGAPASTTVTSGKADDGTPRIGVTVAQNQPNPYTIKFSLDDVGGPSAGLMFSLGIVDKLSPQDLTGGLTIAGTGTIDDEGNVGAIGGIAQKMRGAKRDGATVFLAPAGNCQEAADNAVAGLELVKVSTLDDALTALQKLRDHQTPTLCNGS